MRGWYDHLLLWQQWRERAWRQGYSLCSQFPRDPVGVVVLKEVNVSSMTLSSIRLRGCTGVSSGEASWLSWERGRGQAEEEGNRERERKWVDEEKERRTREDKEGG